MSTAMNGVFRSASPRSTTESAAGCLRLCALVFVLFSATAQAQLPTSVAGTWHVAVPAWGIEDHLLVLQEKDGGLAGKFEFADVSGTVAGTGLRLDVLDENGQLMLHFEGTVSADGMKGKVTSPKNGPLAQHGVAEPLTTDWTAAREAHSG